MSTLIDLAHSVNGNNHMITQNDVTVVLKEIPDPELGVSIVDLGLIYDVKIEDGNVSVLMTLTTMGCPLFEQIAGPAKTELAKLEGVKTVTIDLTFEPPWTPERMTEEAQMQLGLL